MAVEFFNNIDLGTSELQNAVIHKVPTASLPTGVEGQVVYDDTTNEIKYHDGTSWRTVSTAAGTVTSVTAGNAITVTGTSTDPIINHDDTSTVSDLTAVARTYITGMTFDTYGHVQTITTGSETATTDYVNGGTFNSGTGDLSLTGVGSAGATVNLDGRYLQSTNESEGFKTISVSGQSDVVADAVDDTLTFVGGSNVTITTDAGADSITIASQDSIDYVDGVSFASGTGDITFTATGNGFAGTVNLDGRYLQVESDTLDDVTGRGASTTNAITVGGLTVNGDLTVSGAHTVTLAEEIHVEDSIFLLNSNASGAATEDAGLIVERGTDTNVGMIWDETADEFAFINTAETAADSDVTIGSYAAVKADSLNLQTVANAGVDTDKFLVLDGSGNVDFRTGAEVLSDIGAAPASGGGYMEDFIVTDGTTPSTIGDGDTVTVQGSGLISVANVAGTLTVSTTANNYILPDATETVTGGVEMADATEAAAGSLASNYAVTPAGVKAFNDARQYSTTIGNGVDTAITVTHSLGSKKVMVEVVRVSDYKTIYTDVERPTNDTLTVTFASAPATGAFEVFVRRID